MNLKYEGMQSHMHLKGQAMAPYKLLCAILRTSWRLQFQCIQFVIHIFCHTRVHSDSKETSSTNVLNS